MKLLNCFLLTFAFVVDTASQFPLTTISSIEAPIQIY